MPGLGPGSHRCYDTASPPQTPGKTSPTSFYSRVATTPWPGGWQWCGRWRWSPPPGNRCGWWFRWHKSLPVPRTSSRWRPRHRHRYHTLYHGCYSDLVKTSYLPPIASLHWWSFPPQNPSIQLGSWGFWGNPWSCMVDLAGGSSIEPCPDIKEGRRARRKNCFIFYLLSMSFIWLSQQLSICA